MESARKWYSTVSTGFKLILAMLVTAGLAAIGLLAIRGRRRASESRQDTFRQEVKEEISERKAEVAVHHEQAEEHIRQAENLETQATGLDARLQAARDKVARLKKELGR